VEAKQIPRWGLELEIAGPMPESPQRSEMPVEETTLVPYGFTTLRVVEFPWVEE
jgi:hypothetical protein